MVEITQERIRLAKQIQSNQILDEVFHELKSEYIDNWLVENDDKVRVDWWYKVTALIALEERIHVRAESIIRESERRNAERVG